MRVLIVGGTSMVGRRLRAQLAPTSAVSTAGRGGGSDLEFDLAATGPVPDPGTACDALVHCAASFGGETPEGRARNELVNALGAFRVAELAAAANCRHVVYLSSLSGDDHPSNGYFGSYGLSKRHGSENLALACSSAGIAFTSLVLTQVYDEHGEARKHQPLFYHIVDRASRGEDVVLFGRSDAVRNYLFVGDVATIIARVIAGQVAGTFPCTAPVSYRLSEVATMAFEVFDRGGQVRFDPSRPDIPTVYLPDDRRLDEAIGYRPATELREGLARIRDSRAEEVT
ncbi:MAG: NAD(P)-dependent oxidoreductase [Isosphaeraceae bacterium]|nr:NAD(P)-dependent oxidoreductase [Isosphaeraceae bacterium]